MKFTHIAALCALSTAATFTQAAPVWQDFSITGLYGENYAHPVGMVDDLEQTTITAEYAAGLKYGDFFAFADRTNNDLSGNETYFEVAPRLSLGAVSGQKLAVGPIKDVLIATTWEGGEGFDNFLYGVGFDLAIPKFNYASVNLYRVNNENMIDTGCKE